MWVSRVLSQLSRHYSSFPLFCAHEEIEKGNTWILGADDSHMTFFSCMDLLCSEEKWDVLWSESET